MDKQPPLLFVMHDDNDPWKSQIDTRAIASHVSARYKPWRKTNRKSLALDSTTRAILMFKQAKTHGTSRASSRSETASPLTIDPDPNESTQARTSMQYSDRLEKDKEDYAVATVSAPHGLPPSESALSSSDTFQHLFTSQSGRCHQDCALQSLTPRISTFASSFLDPFTSASTGCNHDISSNLHFYFKVIQPFALHLIDDWEWVGNLPYIQASPALAYAVAAYASLFLSGCLKGGTGVVLPPPVKEGETPLWQIPSWFKLQTSCLAELNQLLADPYKVDETFFQAILLLFRIAILLADGRTAEMHYRALKGVSALIGREEPSLDKEMAVAKVNLVGAFLHNSSM